MLFDITAAAIKPSFEKHDVQNTTDARGSGVGSSLHEQVDPSGSGRVAAADAALFLKRSGLADLVLGQVVLTYPG